MGAEKKLSCKDELTTAVIDNGIETWEELTEFVKALPYGRNSNRTELVLVIEEKKGSCSSKHALLKKVADLNNIKDIQLMLGIYRMNQENTPKIGTVLFDCPVDYIPEAHCYLKINGKRTDMTSNHSEFGKIENDIIQEIEILPYQVAEFKVDYHKQFLKRWILENQIEITFNEIWSIREKCISNLTEEADLQ